ncbi:MAG: class I SAM-dependent methyltransferase [Acidobacteriota bacterium]
MLDLPAHFGAIDIYLFDQILRGRIRPGMSIVDVGCGGGRNLVYFLREGYEVRALDPNPEAIHAVRALAKQLAPHLPASNFRPEPAEATTFSEGIADVVLSSAVLHFAPDERAFRLMLRGSWRLVKPGGILFCRLASSIGMENRFPAIGGRRFLLLDGSERFLVDADFLLELTADLGGTLVDPLKTTVVHEQRCMTTWILRKPAH